MEQYLGEIRMFGGNYAPYHWAYCNGAKIKISEQQALSSLMRSTFGGDDRTFFLLPDMRSRVPMGAGQGPGLAARPMGTSLGTPTETLTAGTTPAHAHSMLASEEAPQMTDLAGHVLGHGYFFQDEEAALKTGTLANATFGTSGESASHSNIMPGLGVNFIICMQGTYPQRS